MDHNLLMVITRALPMKLIEVNGQPYLERYFLSQHSDGTQIWLHRFLRNDSEEHVHSHPWTATSYLQCGWYIEELPNGLNLINAVNNINRITPDRLHRVSSVQPNTWTLLVVEPGRNDEWCFIERDGSKKMMKTSPLEWHKDFKPRQSTVDDDELLTLVKHLKNPLPENF